MSDEAMSPPILYLDFDGVLHPADVRVTQDEPERARVYLNGRPSDHPLFEHAPLLERLLEPYPEVQIILATTWARDLGLDVAAEQLPIGLRDRVIDTVWRGSLLEYSLGSRYDTIQADADSRGLTQWLALDDDLHYWPEDRLHLVVAPTDRWLALAQPGVADELSVALNLLCSNRPLEGRRHHTCDDLEQMLARGDITAEMLRQARHEDEVFERVLAAASARRLNRS